MKLLLSLAIIVAALQLPAQRIAVSGKISGEKKDSVWGCFNSTRNEWKGFAVDNSNRFSFSFSPEKYYNFIVVENNEVLLQSGDSVYISFQGDSIVDISGGNSLLNQSLLLLNQSRQSELWNSSREDSLFEFVGKLNQWYNTQLQNIDVCRYVNGNADRDIALSYLNFEVAAVCYASLYAKVSGKDSIKYAEAMNSKEFMRFTEQINFNDTVVGQTLPYYSTLQYYLWLYEFLCGKY